MTKQPTLFSGLTFVLLLLLPLQVLFSQEATNLQQINSAAKTQYVKPETLDQLLIRLRPLVENVPAGQEMLLMDTYRTIAGQYAVNNHFKQAYEVYQKYIAYKESYYSVEKGKALEAARQSVKQRNDADEIAAMDLHNQVQQLQIENDQLISKRANFKKYFSAGLIALTALFASILVGSGLKLNSIRVQLRQSRDRMKELHRISLLGACADGILENNEEKLTSLETGIEQIVTDTKTMQPSGAELSRRAKIITEVLRQLKQLNGKAG